MQYFIFVMTALEAVCYYIVNEEPNLLCVTGVPSRWVSANQTAERCTSIGFSWLEKSRLYASLVPSSTTLLAGVSLSGPASVRATSWTPTLQDDEEAMKGVGDNI